MKEKILQALKLKAASLGFNSTELENVATQIATTIQEDATEEQINAQVDAVIPFLQVSQQAYTRIVNEQKKKPPVPPKEEQNDDDKFDKLLQQIENQGKLIEQMINKDVLHTRSEIFKSKLKNLPESIKNAKLKDFERMSFADDSDFEAYLSEQDEVIKDISQDLSNEALAKLSQPSKGKQTEKQASDEEIKEIINQLNV